MVLIWCIVGVFGAVLLAGIGYGIYFLCSPMPIVKKLRSGMDGELSFPEGYQERAELVEIRRDLPYPSGYGRNTFDLYLPKRYGKGSSQKLPVVVWAHGGAFVAGNKGGVENWAVLLAGEGLCVAAVEYQWAPEAHYPAQVEQIGECIKELERLGREGEPLDMSLVVLAGDSAGAHMAAQTALLHTNPAFAAECGLKPVLAKEAVKAALLYCGPYDIGQMARPENKFLRLAMQRIGWSYFGFRNWQGSKVAESTVIRNYVTEDFPPCYIMDGNAYSFERQGKDLAAALEEKGVRCAKRFFDRSEGEVPHEHQFQLAQKNAWLCYEDTVKFLRELGIL